MRRRKESNQVKRGLLLDRKKERKEERGEILNERLIYPSKSCHGSLLIGSMNIKGKWNHNFTYNLDQSLFLM